MSQLSEVLNYSMTTAYLLFSHQFHFHFLATILHCHRHHRHQEVNCAHLHRLHRDQSNFSYCYYCYFAATTKMNSAGM